MIYRLCKRYTEVQSPTCNRHNKSYSKNQDHPIVGKLDVQRSSLAAHKANIDVWNNTLYYLRALLSALLDTSEGGEKKRNPPYQICLYIKRTPCHPGYQSVRCCDCDWLTEVFLLSSSILLILHPAIISVSITPCHKARCY